MLGQERLGLGEHLALARRAEAVDGLARLGERTGPVAAGADETNAVRPSAYATPPLPVCGATKLVSGSAVPGLPIELSKSIGTFAALVRRAESTPESRLLKA